MPTKKPKPDLVKAADDFSRKYEDVFGDKDPQDIINELRGDGDVPGASMNSSGESAAREQWMMDAAAEFIAPGTPPSMAAHMKEQYAGWIARHYAARAREVQELQRAGERALSIRNLVHSQYRLVWQPKPSVDADANSMADEYENMAQDCENELRAALAPFAAKGETE